MIGVELRDETCGRALKMRSVVRRPPANHPALPIELVSLIVKAMADLVSNGGADRAVINCRVGAGIEERGLKKRWKNAD